jgi:hypothetical protein
MMVLARGLVREARIWPFNKPAPRLYLIRATSQTGGDSGTFNLDVDLKIESSN